MFKTWAKKVLPATLVVWLIPCAEAVETSIYSPQPFEYYQPILERMPFGELPSDLGQQQVDPDAAKEEARLKVEQQKLARQINMSAVNVTPQGKTAVGFTDLSSKPPANYYLIEGSEANGWKLISADYNEEVALLEKDGVSIELKLGKGLVSSVADKAAKPAAKTARPLKTTIKKPVVATATRPKGTSKAKTNTQRAAESAAAIREELHQVRSSGGDVRSYMERLRERKIKESAAMQATQEAQRKQLEKLARDVASKEIEKQAEVLAEEAALKTELAIEEERLKNELEAEADKNE
jgi:hypothetical protein